LTGIPSHHLAALVTFGDLESAAEAVSVLIGSGLEPAALELLTPELISLMNREMGLGLREVPTLFCEFHGTSKGALLETSGLAKELTEGCGGTGFRFGIEEKERLDLWRARHDAWETIHHAHQGKETLIVDAAVPISRYPEMIIYAQRLVDEHNVVGYVFGHAGDGNLHVVMMGDPKNKREWSVLENVNDCIVKRAVELGGTCTGEHGIGIGKRKFMDLEHGQSYDLMRHIKELVDPKGLMNPDKIFF
jgi:D-lactate dehydrogenase (cytochrome)